MEKKLKVFVVGNYTEYANWLPNYVLCKNIEDSNLVLFTGGEDVSPSLYGEPVGKKTSFNIKRDLFEMDMYDKAVKLNKPMLGICRGSQFLCVMNGGRLVQDQENRHFVHPIKTWDGRLLNITSTHHQAQYPYDMGKGSYHVIGWTDGLSNRHLDGNNKEISEKPFKEAEIVFYPTNNSLGIQGHPEYDDMKHYPETMEYLKDLVNNLVNNSFKF